MASVSIEMRIPLELIIAGIQSEDSQKLDIIGDLCANVKTRHYIQLWKENELIFLTIRGLACSHQSHLGYIFTAGEARETISEKGRQTFPVSDPLSKAQPTFKTQEKEHRYVNTSVDNVNAQERGYSSKEVHQNNEGQIDFHIEISNELKAYDAVIATHHDSESMHELYTNVSIEGNCTGESNIRSVNKSRETFIKYQLRPRVKRHVKNDYCLPTHITDSPSDSHQEGRGDSTEHTEANSLDQETNNAEYTETTDGYIRNDALTVCILCGVIIQTTTEESRHVSEYHELTHNEYKQFTELPVDEREYVISAYREVSAQYKATNNGNMFDKVQCQVCGVELSSFVSLLIHHRHIHFDDKISKSEESPAVQVADQGQDQDSSNKSSSSRFPCRFCGQVLAFSGSRLRHEKYYCETNPAREPRLNCPFCCAVFASREALDAHKSVHKGACFVCDQCGRILSTKSGLYNHKMTKHSDKAARYVCSVCQKSFSRRDKYERHMTIHNDARPFVCEFCGKSYKTRQAVIKHHRAVHRNEYRFHCEHCGHGVEKQSYLRKHKCCRVRRTQVDRQIPHASMSPPGEESHLVTTLDQPCSYAAVSPPVVEMGEERQLVTTLGQLCQYDQALAVMSDNMPEPQYVLPGIPMLLSEPYSGQPYSTDISLAPSSSQPLPQILSTLYPATEQPGPRMNAGMSSGLPSYQQLTSYVPLYFESSADITEQTIPDSSEPLTDHTTGGSRQF